MTDNLYILEPEAKVRHDLINPALEKAGWKVQHFKTADICPFPSASPRLATGAHRELCNPTSPPISYSVLWPWSCLLGIVAGYLI